MSDSIKITDNSEYSKRVGGKLLERLNVVATEAIRLKNIIDTAKTPLKKMFYKEKLIKNSLKAEKLIKTLELVRLASEQDTQE